MGKDKGLVQSVKGGNKLNDTGTWIHPYIAVRYISFYYFSTEICKVAKHHGHSIHKTRRSNGTLMVGIAIRQFYKNIK